MFAGLRSGTLPHNEALDSQKQCACAQIFEGNAEGGVVSEHLTTYSGSDIYKQGSLEIKSASPTVTVAFTGISGGPGRGFSMMYQVSFLHPPSL